MTRNTTEKKRQKAGTNERQAPAAVCGIIVCLQFDDSAVPESQKGTLPVSVRLALVIYEKPQSICDINFANECQNDVVPGSVDISL